MAFIILILQSIFIIILSLLPKNFWIKIIIFQGFIGKIFRKENPSKLLIEISNLGFNVQRGFSDKDFELSWYKYYTDIIVVLLDYSRRYGTPIKKILQSLKIGIQKDARFEIKIKRELKEGFLQFLLTALITWAFAFFVNLLVGIKTSFYLSSLIISLQLAGVLFFIITYTLQKKRKFLVFESYLCSLYSMQSLIEVGLSSTEVLKNACIGSILEDKDMDFSEVRRRLDLTISNWKKSGIPIKFEIDDLIAESWFLLEERFIRFQKFLSSLKFIILVVFFLSSYFIYLFSLFESFLIE